MRSAILAAAALVLPAGTLAADIVSARYDAAADELVVDIAYRGTGPGHDFRLEWGQCEPGGEAVARLIDRQGGDAAREPFRVTQRFDPAPAGCRPERVTLRLGRVSHATVRIAEQAVSAPKPWLDVLASDLIGSKVSNALGEDLGTIEDVVVDVPGEAVRYAVLAFPAERERFAVPMTQLLPIIGTERLQLTVDRAALVVRGGIETDRLPPHLASVTQLMAGEVRDLVLNFSTRQVRGVVLDSGETVASSALASSAGAGGTRAEPADRLSEPR
jgi:sporulation protein YlmC with PRC-barrel domain